MALTYPNLSLGLGVPICDIEMGALNPDWDNRCREWWKSALAWRPLGRLQHFRAGNLISNLQEWVIVRGRQGTKLRRDGPGWLLFYCVYLYLSFMGSFPASPLLSLNLFREFPLKFSVCVL